MNDEKQITTLQLTIQALVEQRNNAMNALADSTVALTEARAKIAELEASSPKRKAKAKA